MFNPLVFGVKSLISLTVYIFPRGPIGGNKKMVNNLV